jgi:UDP-GlcNAc:undecaprenyl-phosphate GlcNAc-1-phosphate transferase
VNIWLPFLAGLLTSAALVPICRAIALRFGYAVPLRPAEAAGPPDAFAQAATAPGQGRHDAPRAKALFGGVPLALAVFLWSTAFGTIASVPVLAICSAVLLALGLWSDRYPLKPSSKVVVQVAVACVFLAFHDRLHWASSETLDALITVFWIVGITSAFNLLDNMDGLCAGIALISGSAFLITVLPVPAAAADLLAKTQYLAVLLGAIAGFLIFNVHPAAMALGEGGSLFIGIHMAAMTVQVAPGRGSNLLSIVGVPLLVLMIPLVDALFTTVSRLRAGQTPASIDHSSSHRLVAIGLSQRSAVGLLWMLAAAAGAIAVVSDRTHQGLAEMLAAMFTAAMALFALYLGRIRVHEDAQPDQLPGTITPLGIEFPYRRRLAEVLLDLLLVSFAYYAAYRLRFEDAHDFAANFGRFEQSYPLVVGTQMVAFLASGAYRGMWRYFSLSDGVTLLGGTIVGVVGAFLAIGVVYGYHGYSQSVFILYPKTLLLLTVGSRASFRAISEFAQRRRQTGRRLVLYGAGDAGAMAVRSLLNDARSAYRILGFVDDDVRKRNVRVHGYRVIGGYDHLVGMIVANEVDAVAVTQEGIDTAGLSRLCANYAVALYRVGLDWMEIPVVEPKVSGGEPLRTIDTPSLRQGFGGPGVTPFTARGRAQLRAVDSGDAAVRPQPGTSDERIRVVHVITRLILGGAQENTLSTVIGQHQDPRFDVTLLTGIDEAGEGNMFSQAAAAGVNMTVMPSLLREIRPVTDVKAVFDLYRFFKRGRFAVVHTHSSKAGIVGRIAAKLAGVPVVVHSIHGLAFHEYQSKWKNLLYVSLERLCAPMSQKLVSVSERISENAMAEGIGRREQHVRIFSGIELELFLTARDRFTLEEAKVRAGLPPDAPVVGKIARLFELKGHEQFLAAAAEIAQAIPETHFLLVGDGPLRDQLRADAERLGIGERLVMVGRVPPEEVPNYIQAMDVVVHTSLREGIARVLPQAGAVGKPVVTFELDGAPEVVTDGVNGYLAPPIDTHVIATRTIELLRDPERRRAFGEAGRAFAAANFGVDTMVRRISELYLDLLVRA